MNLSYQIGSGCQKFQRSSVLRCSDGIRLRHTVERGGKVSLEIAKVEEFEAITARGVQGTIGGTKVQVGSRRLLEEGKIPLDGLDETMTRLEKEGKTAILVVAGGRAAGVVAVADTLKDDSKEAIAELKKMEIHPIMITGDNERTARAIAAQVGIDDVMADILPEGKVDAVRRLQKEHGNVIAMVGDGIISPEFAGKNCAIVIIYLH